MKNISYKILFFLTIGFLFGACDDEGNAIPERTKYVTSGAMIRFSHASQEGPMVNFYLDDQKVTTKSATGIGRQTGLFWSSTLSNTIHPTTYGYVNVPAGSYTLQAVDTSTIKGAVTLAKKVIASAPVQLEDNVSYTAYLVGKAGSLELLTVKDELPPIDFSRAYIRFVNAMPGTPGDFDVKAIRTAPDAETIPVATSVAFKGESGYVPIPAGTYDFALYLNGSTTAYTTYTGGAIVAGRVYTFYTKGNYVASPGTINRQLLRER